MDIIIIAKHVTHSDSQASLRPQSVQVWTQESVFSTCSTYKDLYIKVYKTYLFLGRKNIDNFHLSLMYMFCIFYNEYMYYIHQFKNSKFNVN